MKEQLAETTNGLADYMALANLTAVGAGIVIFVVLSIWIVTNGIPSLIERWDKSQQRSDTANAESRREFITALNQQASARTESAKGGHDAALRIADNLDDLTKELRRMMDDRPRPAANGRMSVVS
jgi:flagellar biosynthesis/type III secretory pathway M-ring protein FliF/YscJ